MRLLRSFEEFVFEAVTWLVLYPLMIWRIVTRPLATMAYSDSQQEDTDAARYDDGLSPPLLLLVTIFVVNTVAGTLHLVAPVDSPVAREVFSSPQFLALFRALIFSLIPLISAVTLLRLNRVPLSRSALRPPFYAQCYLATPCCLALGIGAAMIMRPDVPTPLSAIPLIGGGIWFAITEVRWFRSKLGKSWGAAILTFAQTLVLGLAALTLVVLAVYFL